MAGALEQRRAEELTARLIQQANPSGGWPYYVGKKSRLEPTCWALLALHGAWTGSETEWSRVATTHLEFVQRSQRRGGLLSDSPDAPVNLAAAGLAACTLAALSPSSRTTILPALLGGIVALKGIRVNEPDTRQDNTLQAWPWYPETFSWVEPTAWCVLALKKLKAIAPPDSAARIAEAERMLENRCCEIGGWNYGNASALGQDLRPHVPPTAMALLSLHDRRDRPFVVKSIDFLDGAQLKEQSGAALGLTALCLRVYGRDPASVEARLAEVSVQTEALGNIHSMAIALHALTGDRHQAQVFRVAE